MRLTIDALLNGKGTEIPAHFVAAKERWESLLSNRDPESAVDLARDLAREQSFFEEMGAGRIVGKEIMAIAGIAYALGQSEELAVAVARAIRASMCSTEVKSAAQQVVDLYGLDTGPGTRW